MPAPRTPRSRQAQQTHTFDQKTQVTALLRLGRCDADIAAELAIPVQVVTKERIVQSATLPRFDGDKPFSVADDQAILSLRNAKGRTWLNIGEHLGRPSDHIRLRYDFLTEQGLRISPFKKRGKRTCLAHGCGVLFVSEHAGNRRCDACTAKLAGEPDTYLLLEVSE